MSKKHVLCKGTSKFKISEKTRGLMCLIGQSAVFDSGVCLFRQMMSIELSAPQIQRVCEYVGGAMDELIEANRKAVIPQLEPKDSTDHTYIMIDGSMVFTREDKWKEMKLGRIFHDSQVVDIQ